MSKLAETLRARAAAGEDFAKLQKEAFDAAGMKIESPTVNLPNVRRTGLASRPCRCIRIKARRRFASDQRFGRPLHVQVDQHRPPDARPSQERNPQQIAKRSNPRNDGQGKRLVQGGNQRGVLWARAEWAPCRRPDDCRVPRQMQPGRSGSAAANRSSAATAGGKTELMAKPVVVVTGVSGNLGSRLLPLLGSYSVIGVDVSPPRTDSELQFEALDLGQESSTRVLVRIATRYPRLRGSSPCLCDRSGAFGVLDVERMWQINVSGTARVMEAVTEANRTTDDGVKQFIFPSSVSAYGPNLPAPATEDSLYWRRTLFPTPYIKNNRMKSCKLARTRCAGCSAYILRPHIFAGASVENYLMGAFRGTPNGKSSRAEKMRKEGKRLPCMFPRGQQYLDNKIQFIHVDDMARLIRHILQREPEPQRLTIMNVAGKRRTFDFRSLRRNGACKIGSRPRQMGDAAGAEISVEAEDFCHSPRSCPLHDGRVHHEYRPPAPVPGPRVRSRDPLHHHRRVRGQFHDI